MMGLPGLFRRRGGGARGLSLVELMIVVAVLGIVSTIFLARGAMGRKDAIDTRALALLDLMRGAAIGYEIEKGTFPANLTAPATQWDTFVTTLESTGSVSQLPRWAAVSGIFGNSAVRFVAGENGDPLTMVVLPSGGSGAVFRATPYTMYQCAGTVAAPTSCAVLK